MQGEARPADQARSRTKATKASAARVCVRPKEGAKPLAGGGRGAPGGESGGAPALAPPPLRAPPAPQPRRKVRLDCRARDERDAVARLHRAADRLLQPELERDREVAQANAERAELVLDDLPHARALLHQDQRLGAQLLDIDRAPREPVARRADEDHLVLENWLELDGAVPPRSADDPELEPALGDQVDDRLGVVHLEGDPQAGMKLVELAEQDGHDDGGGAGRGSDRKLTRELSRAVG